MIPPAFTVVIRGMGVMIEYPALALIPLALFLGLWAWRRRPLLLWTGIAWGGYAAYETGMRLRLLCSGECNIRIDLVLIYPVLLILSVAGIVACVRRGSAP